MPTTKYCVRYQARPGGEEITKEFDTMTARELFIIAIQVSPQVKILERWEGV